MMILWGEAAHLLDHVLHELGLLGEVLAAVTQVHGHSVAFVEAHGHGVAQSYGAAPPGTCSGLKYTFNLHF